MFRAGRVYACTLRIVFFLLYHHHSSKYYVQLACY